MRGGENLALTKSIKRFQDSYCNEFVDYLFENGKSDATIVFYVSYLQQIMRHLGKNPTDDFSYLTKSDILRYIHKLKESNLSAHTVNKYITTMNCFFKFKKMDFHFPFLKVQKQQFVENVIGNDEAKALIEYFRFHGKDCLYAITATLLMTGMRINEVLHLQASQIDKKIIIVSGKGRSRKVFLCDKLRAILKDYVTHNNISGYLWDKQYGHDTNLDGRVSNINKALKYYGEKIGIPSNKLHAHSFRHRFAINLLESGQFTVADVAAILGHSGLTIVLLYLKKSETELYEIFNKLA